MLVSLFLSSRPLSPTTSFCDLVSREVYVDNNENTQDARLILQLRLMCRDPEMHSAHLWWRDSFWPETVDDYLKVEAALGTPENVRLGQVISYWGMAAALVAQGTLGEHALLSADFSEGLFEVFCKLRPFLADLRKRTRKPGLLRNIEGLVTGSKRSRQRLAIVHKQFVLRRKEMSHRLAKAS